MIDTIIFDGEGVVVDTESIWDRGQEEFLLRRNVAYDREQIKPLLTGRSMEEGARILQVRYGFGGDPVALARERIEIVKELFSQEVRFVPGFENFYRDIRDAFKTCVATVMPQELLEIVVEKLGLRALFGSHIYSPEVNQLPAKPAPDLFLYAAKQLGSSPERCIVIEDSPNGIEAARRASMLCIGIATTFAPEKLAQADIVVKSFDEIRSMQGQFERPPHISGQRIN